VLIAIVEALRLARDRGAQQVTVMCSDEEAVARLNRHQPTAWNEPMAGVWRQARALAHGFARCYFVQVPEARVRSVIGRAREAAEGQFLMRAA
jgi:hypothetical protein